MIKMIMQNKLKIRLFFSHNLQLNQVFMWFGMIFDTHTHTHTHTHTTSRARNINLILYIPKYRNTIYKSVAVFYFFLLINFITY
jgi:hypothetical protein